MAAESCFPLFPLGRLEEARLRPLFLVSLFYKHGCVKTMPFALGSVICVDELMGFNCHFHEDPERPQLSAWLCLIMELQPG